MAIRPIALTLSLIALAIAAPQASAQLPLPEPRTHVDPAGAIGDPESPRLTFLDPDTKPRDLRRGYLYVRARCDARCVVAVTASTKISGKQREVATARKTLPANRVRRIRLRIRSDVRRRLMTGATFRFVALPLAVPDA